MNQDHLEEIKKNIESEPFAKFFGIKVLDLEKGYSKVQMKIKKSYDNIFSITHGGAIFSLMDVAFGSAANSYGTVAVALNVSINYIKSVNAGDVLTAEASEVNRGKRTSTFNIVTRNGSGEIVASSQNLAYLKDEKLPFLK